MHLYQISKFWSEGAICSGFLYFCSALESVKKPCSLAPPLPHLHPKGTEEASAFWLGCICTQKTSESFAHQDLKFSLLSEFPSQGRCQVTQICQGRLPRRAPSPCLLGDSSAARFQCWQARHLLFPTPSIRLQHHLLKHPKRVRGPGHNRWLELMPEE